MGIQILRTFPFGNLQLYTGRFYLFKYSNFTIDPEPLILFMNVHWGKNPKTGHMHQFIQGINMHYLEMSKRLPVYQRWIKINVNESFATKNFLKFYEMLKRAIPNVDFAVRRYLINPPGLITNIRQLDNDFMIEYFTNPVKVLERAWDTAEKVLLAGKIRAMKVQLKEKS